MSLNVEGKKYKFAVMILYFDCEQFILRTIENCAPFVDKIYIMYSDLPYSKYNPEARNNYKNKARKEVIYKSEYVNKVEIIEGIWNNEEEQRNDCLNQARSEGFDFLIIQDADEFYLAEDYQKNLLGINSRPDYNYYQVPWIVFWKNTNYVLQYRKHGTKRNVTITTCPVYAVNLKKENHFIHRRILYEMNSPLMLEGLCFHFSWLLSDEDVYRKISTWSHADQVNLKKWFKWKWSAWEPNTKHIDVFNHISIKRAIPYNGTLPKEIENFPPLKQEFFNLSKLERFFRWLSDLKYFIKLIIKWPFYIIFYRRNLL